MLRIEWMANLKPNPGQVARRKAAHILNSLAIAVGLGRNEAHHFDPETPSDWVNIGPDTVQALRGKYIIATIQLGEGTSHHLTLTSWSDLVRNEHLYDFEPERLGLIPDNRVHFLTKEPYPDSVGPVDFGEPQALYASPRPIPKRSNNKSIEVIR